MRNALLQDFQPKNSMTFLPGNLGPDLSALQNLKKSFPYVIKIKHRRLIKKVTYQYLRVVTRVVTFQKELVLRPVTDFSAVCTAVNLL